MASTYQFLTKKNVIEVYQTSKQYTEGLTDDFPEYERIARNKPHPSVPKGLPKTTDGTTASIVRKTPHRIIQQLPTGKITSDTEDWLSVVAEFIYTHKIIPYANEGYALIQKSWQVVERFLTFGSCATYTPFVNHDGYFCTDLRLVYWGDIFLQPGKLSDADSNYIFLRSWWQTKDIDALIASQSKLSKDTEQTWDVKALQEVKDIVITKDEKAKTPTEKEKNTNAAGGVELVTGFQKGYGANFFTFHESSGKVVRTKKNTDPRGKIPINFAYGDTDGSNPLGRGVVELIGGMQNLMDGEVQMYQYNRALMLNPPVIKSGNFPKTRVKFQPNAIIDVGTDPNARLEALKIDTSAIQNFPNNYSLMKSQMLYLVSSPDGSGISAEAGNPSNSKTPAGVKLTQATLSIDDNYIRKQFETWFENWSETAINLFFAERTGVEELQLDKKTANQLRKLAAEGRFDEELLSEDNRVRIDYDTATPQLRFEVDASTSKVQDEVRELQSLQGLTQLLDKTEMLQRSVPIDKVLALWNAIVANAGVQNPDELAMDEKEIEQAKKAATEVSNTREYLNINYKDAPEDVKRQIEQMYDLQPSQMTSPVQQQVDAKVQNNLTPEHLLKADQQAHQQGMDMAQHALSGEKQQQEMQMAQAQPQSQGQSQGQSQPPSQPNVPPSDIDQQIIQKLQELGVPPAQIQQALALLHQGMSVEEVMKMIMEVTGARG